MEKLYSAAKNEIIFDQDLLYVLRFGQHQTNITSIEIKTLSVVDELLIECQLMGQSYPCLDMNNLYLIDAESNLLMIDRISRETFNKRSLKAVCIANVQQDNDYLYLLCVLPTKTKQMQFSAYFVQKIEKRTGKIVKFSHRQGSPVRSLILKNEELILGDLDRIICLNKNGQEKWTVSLRRKTNKPFVYDDEYIIASSSRGEVQGIEIKGGKNKFNVQLPNSEHQPVLAKNLFWLTPNYFYILDVEKICRRIHNWQTQIKHTLQPTCFMVINGEPIIGDLLGNITTGISKKEKHMKVTKNAILSIEQMDEKKIVCETAVDFHIVDLQNE